MKRNIFSFLSAALLVSGLLFTTPAIRAQMRSNPPMGGQNGNMNQQPGMPPNNMPPNGAMNQQNSPQANMERNFLANMRRNINVENDLSKMALKNSSNDDVKKLAQQVISQNRRFESQVNMSASNDGPTFAPAVPSETRKAEKQMKKLTGTPFDGMYLSQMDGYVKNDQKITSDASLASSTPDLRALVMQLRVQADQRAQQIAQVAQSANIKIQ